MPGLAGVATSSTIVTDADLAPMRAALRHRAALLDEQSVDAEGRWAIARIHLGHLQRAPQLRAGVSVQVILHGELHNEAELRQAAGKPVGAADTAALLAALYERLGVGFLGRLKGSYSLALIDSRTRTVLLATDAVGSYPLYWSHAPGHFVFGSTVSAVLKGARRSARLDPRAVADYVHFGLVMGEKTLAEGVHLVAPGSLVAYGWDDDEVECHTYRPLQDLFARADDSADSVERLVETFNTAVNRSVSGSHRLGLALSGGLDSRAILSAVNGSHDRVATYTVGQRHCADHVIGEQLARLAGTSHRFFELTERYLDDFLPNLTRMIALTDGMYLSHGLAEMLALRFAAESDYAVLLRGHGGELAKTTLAWPFHTDSRVDAMHSTGEFVDYILHRANYVSRGADLQSLFAPDFAGDMRTAARESLERSVGGTTLSPPELCSYVYLRELHRRFTVPSLELFRSVVEVRLPFLDDDFLQALLGTPTRLRAGTAIHRAITASNCPAMLRVRNSNTGVAAGATARTEAIFDKFNTLLRRLNAPGFRHYHNFAGWMSRMLFASAETVLLDPASLRRGVVQASAVRRLIDDTRSGAADHAYLLQVLLILELWQREQAA